MYISNFSIVPIGGKYCSGNVAIVPIIGYTTAQGEV